MPGEEAQAVADQIVRYLHAHPDAADTVEGAARWWLGREPLDPAIVQAFALLVERGAVERHMLPDGTVVFRAAST